MDETYLYPVKKGKWAISRLVRGAWINLIQDAPLDNESDANTILWALRISPTQANLNRYFPLKQGHRCPTLELLELCNVLDPTNPQIKNEKEHGV